MVQIACVFSDHPHIMPPLSGGRGNRDVLDRVVGMRQDGANEDEIRQALKNDNYKPARISQLVSQTRPPSTSSTAAPSGLRRSGSPAASQRGKRQRQHGQPLTSSQDSTGGQKRRRRSTAEVDMEADVDWNAALAGSRRGRELGMPDQMPTRGRKQKVKYSIMYHTMMQHCIT